MTDENVTNDTDAEGLRSDGTASETKASTPYDALFKQVMTDLFNALP